MRKEIIAIGILAVIAVCATLAMAAPQASNSQKDVTADEVVVADIEIQPEHEKLNLQSSGTYITVLINDVGEYDLEDVKVETVMLYYEDKYLATVDPDAPTKIGDCDDDNNNELMVKFDRAEVIDALDVPDLDDMNDCTRCVESEITLTVKGEVDDSTFEGYDDILLVIPHNWEPEQ